MPKAGSAAYKELNKALKDAKSSMKDFNALSDERKVKKLGQLQRNNLQK